MRSSPVYIVDDHEAVRATIAASLQSAGHDARPYASGEAFLREADIAEDGCVILDLEMPGLDGMQVLRRLNDVGSGLAAIMLTGDAAVPQAVAALKAGAIDFLEKPYDRDVLLVAVEKALAAARTRSAASAARRRIEALTPRERDVLLALVRGGPNREIAAAMGLSPRTVEMHRANMMARLGVHTLPEALRIAYDAGFAAERRSASSPPQAGGRRSSDR